MTWICTVAVLLLWPIFCITEAGNDGNSGIEGEISAHKQVRLLTVIIIKIVFLVKILGTLTYYYEAMK